MPTLKKTSARKPAKKSEKAPMIMEQKSMPLMMSQNESPYSLAAMIAFLNGNFLMLFFGLVLFGFGFWFGSMWRENKTLKAGVGTAGTQQAAQQQAAPPAGQPLSDADWKEIQKDPVFVIGDKNAKITMVQFTDYQCPFCEQFYTQTEKQLVDDYVKTGKMKIIMKDQPLPFHPNSNSAAQLVRCAVEQGKGQQMHDQLFSNQTVWTPLSGDALNKKYAELVNAAGANGDKAVSCLTSGKYKAATDADSALGNKVGAGGTPTFFIEKDPLVGAQPLASFKAKIDEKLGVKD